jgi:hypothetical protein
MYDDHLVICPTCGVETAKTLEEEDFFVCDHCATRFSVMVDPETGKIGLVEPMTTKRVHPLWLPKGSIRAITALAVTGTCWYLLLIGASGDRLPSALLSLALTIVGYYFGFRARAKAAEGSIYDARERLAAPLFLPGGWIRAVLMIGFAASALVAGLRGGLRETELLGFFVILAGLMAGHLVGRTLNRAVGVAEWAIFNHVKGLIVLAVTALLVFQVIRAAHTPGAETKTLQIIILCSLVSFYYGSRG